MPEPKALPKLFPVPVESLAIFAKALSVPLDLLGQSCPTGRAGHREDVRLLG
jgi:hypothetical protein